MYSTITQQQVYTFTAPLHSGNSCVKYQYTAARVDIYSIITLQQQMCKLPLRSGKSRCVRTIIQRQVYTFTASLHSGKSRCVQHHYTAASVYVYSTITQRQVYMLCCIHSEFNWQCFCAVPML